MDKVRISFDHTDFTQVLSQITQNQIRIEIRLTELTLILCKVYIWIGFGQTYQMDRPIGPGLTGLVEELV